MKDVLISTIYASPTRQAQPGETLRGLSDEEAQQLVEGGFGSYVAAAAPSPDPERRSPKREKATTKKAATAAAPFAETATAPPPADGKTD